MAKRSALHQSDSVRSLHSTKSNVSFTTIEVREHAMILGDGPSASGGPAVELDWNSQSESTMDLNEYEASKLKRKPSSYPQLMIPGSFRTAILLESGYTMTEVEEAASKASRTTKPSLSKSISAKLLRMLKSSRSSKSCSWSSTIGVGLPVQEAFLQFWMEVIAKQMGRRTVH